MSNVNQGASAAGVASQTKPLPPSPCVGICTLNEAYGICDGCGRTPDDIARWPDADAVEKATIWKALPGRLAKLGVTSFRLPAAPERIGEFLAHSLAAEGGRWAIGLPHAMLQFKGDGGVQVSQDEKGAGAVNGRGDRIGLLAHDRVRAFGLAGGNEAGVMQAVALVLPRGRAGLSDEEAAPDTGVLPLKGGDAYARYDLIVADAAQRVAVADVIAREPSTWADRERQVIRDAKLRVESVLGWIETAADPTVIAAIMGSSHGDRQLRADGDDRRPAVPRAFAICATFHLDDDARLADLIAA
jgi:predicted Fe-S protein YdhL (DUF1289 family)